MTDTAEPSDSEFERDRARLVGINHVALEVGEINDALEFYESLFAFDLRNRSETKAFIDMGDQFIALAASDDANETTDRARHFGLVVNDATKVERRLEECDVDRLDVPGLEFHDPWGNRVQVVDYEAIQFTKTDHILEGMGLALEKTDEAVVELEKKGLGPDSA